MGGFLCTGKKDLFPETSSDLEGPLFDLKSPGDSAFGNSYSFSNKESFLKDHHYHYRRQSPPSPPSVGGQYSGATISQSYTEGHCSNSSQLYTGDTIGEGSDVDDATTANMSPARPRPIKWKKGDLLGTGAFGRVFIGQNVESGELIAVKEVFINAGTCSKKQAQDHVRALEEEVAVLRNLSHPNIVSYLGTQKGEDTVKIFLEYAPGGSIAHRLTKFGPFKEPMIQSFTRQILCGLEYLHRNGIIHRDIKGANMLTDSAGNVKLADFGASKKIEDLATMSAVPSLKGTPYWMAPEAITVTNVGRPADIWSVGCTVVEMASGKPPWSDGEGNIPTTIMFRIMKATDPPALPEHLSARAKDFILKCLQRDPKRRPTASELLQHPFLADSSNNSSDQEPSPSPRRRRPVEQQWLRSPSQSLQTASLASIRTDYNPVLVMEDASYLDHGSERGDDLIDDNVMDYEHRRPSPIAELATPSKSGGEMSSPFSFPDRDGSPWESPSINSLGEDESIRQASSSIGPPPAIMSSWQTSMDSASGWQGDSYLYGSSREPYRDHGGRNANISSPPKAIVGDRPWREGGHEERELTREPTTSPDEAVDSRYAATSSRRQRWEEKYPQWDEELHRDLNRARAIRRGKQRHNGSGSDSGSGKSSPREKHSKSPGLG